MKTDHIVPAGGWHAEEADGAATFRWMSREATAEASIPDEGPAPLLVLVAGHPFAARPYPRLRVFVDGELAGEREIEPAFRSYAWAVTARGAATVRLSLDREHHAPGDGRPLGVMVRRLSILSDPGAAPLFADGWYGEESGDIVPFRWMAGEARLRIPRKDAAARFLSVPIFSEFAGGSQTLTVLRGGRRLATIALLPKWKFYGLRLEPGGAATPGAERTDPDPGEPSRPAGWEGDLDLELRVNKTVPEAAGGPDTRRRGVRVGPLEFHSDAEAFREDSFHHANALLNHREMMEGATALKSFPTNLGIDLYGRCNIKPPCVYCLWDLNKATEGPHAGDLVDPEALERYGPFFAAARTLVNCSIGEPLLHPRFGDLMDFFARRRKILEMATNGQAFTERTVAALAGRSIILYVSLDAARPETYARIRNDRWDDVWKGLLRLAEARKAAGGRPRIYMVFMPMRVNVGDLEDYVKLCRRIDADALVLRPLLYVRERRVMPERGGYTFDYQAELLGRDEVVEVVARAEALCRENGIALSNQFDFGLRPGDGGSAGGAS